MNNLTYESTDKLIKMYDNLTQYALDDIVERIVQNEVITGTAEYPNLETSANRNSP